MGFCAFSSSFVLFFRRQNVLFFLGGTHFFHFLRHVSKESAFYVDFGLGRARAHFFLGFLETCGQIGPNVLVFLGGAHISVFLLLIVMEYVFCAAFGRDLYGFTFHLQCILR